MNPEQPITYASSGVKYEDLDPHKRESLKAAMQTYGALERLGYKVVGWTSGESVFLIETPHGYLGIVIEGLGTKSLVADFYGHLSETIGVSYYEKLAKCNAAMAFNDAITLGVRIVVYNQYVAVGSSEWLTRGGRRKDLIEGTKNACLEGQAAWGGGETPGLTGIIFPEAVDLAGAVVGVIQNKEELIDPANIRAGDKIIFLSSSGIHANGLSLARKVAEKIAMKHDPWWRKLARKLWKKLPPSKDAVRRAYHSMLEDGTEYGAALLEPTHIYARFIEACLDAGIKIKYCVNITGHGWRKLMRANQSFAYVIEKIMRIHPVFDFIQRHAGLTLMQMYETFNMGAGFALYADPADVDKVLQIAREGAYPFEAQLSGHIEASAVKKVVIKPHYIEFASETLQVR